MRHELICLALMCLCAPVGAAVVPALPFTDNAVLQRDKPIPVWGTAEPGEKVTVAFASHTVATTADASGKWRVDLPALPANAKAADLIIRGKNTLTLTNILVGEVWLASGQSNMEQMVKETFDADLDIPASARFPQIRHLRTGYKVSDTPLTVGSGTWQVAGPATTGEFSAIAYFYARVLTDALDVPIGIINSTRGASRIQPWMDAAALGSDPSFAIDAQDWARKRAAYPALKAKMDANIAQWEKDKAAATSAAKPFNAPRPSPGWAGLEGGPDDQFMPSGLYNGMIQPLVPYALRGVIWYQGEGNSGNHLSYRKHFPTLIGSWRTNFAQGDFPFYWVQLSSYGDPQGINMPFLREAQTHTLSVPGTGQAISLDLGETTNIHPRRKYAVAQRLARVALARTYGHKIVDTGPVFAKAEREGAGFRVTFDPRPEYYDLCAFQVPIAGFEMAGSDRVFKPAIAVLGKDQNSVVVTCADIADPVAVRYAWRDATAAGLYSHDEGLPAVPFRSDTWER